MSGAFTYGSVCSGMEAASLAWAPLGWKCAFVSEIDKAPCALLKERYPDVPNFGDMTKFEDWPDVAIDLLVGGTPCQSFSVAGLRKGLADPRGSLMLSFGAVAKRYRPAWLLWENVPGVLSSNEGRDFGAFLGMLAELGYGFAHRVLDAQFFGLAQRRARVFVVGYLGDWRPPAAVLFEPESLRGDPPPSREAQQGIASTVAGGARRRGGYSHDDTPQVSYALNGHAVPHGRLDGESQTFVPLAYGIDSDCFDRSGEAASGDAGSRSGFGIQPELSSVVRAKRPNAVAFKASHFTRDKDGAPSEISPPLSADADKGDQDTLVMAFDTTQITSAANRSQCRPGDACHPVTAEGHAPAIAFSCKDHGADAGELAPTLRAMGHDESHANAGGQLAVAFDARQSDVIQYGDMSGPLDTDGSSIGLLVVSAHAPEPETNTVEALRALWLAVGEEAFSQWGLGVLASLLPTQVLRPSLHGIGVRRPAEPKRGLVNVALSRSQAGAVWSMQDLWEAGCDGCPPQGWRPHEQCARELGAYLSKLPYEASSAQGFMRALRQADEGSRLLRNALSAVEEVWRSLADQDQSAHAGYAVRRLTARECEALQGAPRGWTEITYCGKPMADGPRYKMIGNSFAVNVVRWLGERISLVHGLKSEREADGTIVEKK